MIDVCIFPRYRRDGYHMGCRWHWQHSDGVYFFRYQVEHRGSQNVISSNSQMKHSSFALVGALRSEMVSCIVKSDTSRVWRRMHLHCMKVRSKCYRSFHSQPTGIMLLKVIDAALGIKQNNSETIPCAVQERKLRIIWDIHLTRIPSA